MEVHFSVRDFNCERESGAKTGIETKFYIHTHTDRHLIKKQFKKINHNLQQKMYLYHDPG